MRTLITNDDGISSEGIRVLAKTAQEQGLEVTVAAPLTEASGSAASLIATGKQGKVVLEEHQLPELPDVPAYAVAASPGYIVTIGARGAFGKPPDVVLSGINRGANTGRAVLHSGTVGAALTGSLNGCRAMAFSLDVGWDPKYCHWDTAARLAEQLLPLVMHTDEMTVININVPNAPMSDIRGIRQASLTHYGSVQMTVAEMGKGFIRTTVGADEAGEIAAQSEPGSDLALLAAGFVTVTALRPYCEAIESELSLPVLAEAPVTS